MTDKHESKAVEAVAIRLMELYGNAYIESYADYIEDSKEIIEALGVIILPADAEPMVGDGCIYIDDPDFIFMFSYDVPYDLDNMKIIHRDGKPVLQDTNNNQ